MKPVKDTFIGIGTLCMTFAAGTGFGFLLFMLRDILRASL